MKIKKITESLEDILFSEMTMNGVAKALGLEADTYIIRTDGYSATDDDCIEIADVLNLYGDANGVEEKWSLVYRRGSAEESNWIYGEYYKPDGKEYERNFMAPPIRNPKDFSAMNWYEEEGWKIREKILAKSSEEINEDLEDDFKVLMQAGDYKCKLTKYDMEEAADYDMLLEYIKSAYEIISDEYGADTIKFWRFTEDGFRIIFKDGTRKNIDIQNDRVTELDESMVKAEFIDGMTIEQIDDEIDAMWDNDAVDNDRLTDLAYTRRVLKSREDYSNLPQTIAQSIVDKFGDKCTYTVDELVENMKTREGMRLILKMFASIYATADYKDKGDIEDFKWNVLRQLRGYFNGGSN